ncbi:MAG: glycogen debranching protein GlgX, partial [Alphaproteobacteria bacterium]|nr:glycogen debranching protein GlgX [Alphaproteobacteria bacterium]
MAAPFSASAGAGDPLGVTVVEGGVNVAVVSASAERIDFCLFDETDREIGRVPLRRTSDFTLSAFVSHVIPGMRYGLRADGPYDPVGGQWFDPAKLLVDPYVTEIDRPFVLADALSAPRSAGIDTAKLVPKGVVRVKLPPLSPRPAKIANIYELSLRSFTKLHPAVPEAIRGTAAALAHPAVLEYLTRLGVDSVEIMPVSAWIDDRHLPSLGLKNAWGYNPVTLMAPDPRLAPGGLADLRLMASQLRLAGISVLLDLVFNHTGESDILGPTLSFRGLDNRLYYRHMPDGRLVNDAGTGNVLATEHPQVTRLVVDAMRTYADATGIDGFRLDLAVTIARMPDGFSATHPLLKAIADDPVLGRLTLIAEPWDVGPGGYQLGHFPAPWREWNDRFRDDVRLFWRGDAGRVGSLATRIAGSSDFFGGRRPGDSVNFVAAHDGFTIRDLTSFSRKHNEANGEDNRDGTDENFSWNNGVEGPAKRPETVAERVGDVRAMLATLYLARGTPMLTAGDEFGRTQNGNNNAYAQDNSITWLDWAGADMELSRFVAGLIALRKNHPGVSANRFLDGRETGVDGLRDAVWMHPDGREMGGADWEAADLHTLGLALFESGDRIALWLNA